MRSIFIFTFLLLSFNFVAQENDALLNAEKLIDNKKFTDALSILNPYIEQYPSDFKALILRGKSNRKIGNYDVAFLDITTALKINRNYTLGYAELGKLYIMKESYTLALSNLNKAIQIDSTFQDAYASRGTLYSYYLNKDSLGLLDLNKAIQLDSTDVSARYNRSNIYSDKENYTEALNDLNFCLNKNPNDHLALNARGNCYYELKEYNKAIVDYSKALESNSELIPQEFLNPGDIYFSIGACYANLNKSTKARYYFNKAQEYGVGPDSEKSKQTFGENLFKPTIHFNNFNSRGYFKFKSY